MSRIPIDEQIAVLERIEEELAERGDGGSSMAVSEAILILHQVRCERELRKAQREQKAQETQKSVYS